MSSLKGVIAAVATPVTEDLSIDLDRLLEHCGWLLGAGRCDGINLLGTTGEATSFSTSQRLAAMQAVAVSGLPLQQFMVGTGAAALDDAVQLTAAARNLGFAGALLVPPFYYKQIDDGGLTAFIDAVIGRVGGNDLPLYLYHFPANSGVPYPVDVVASLRDRYPETVRGLKDSSGDLAYSAELARRLPGFDVFPSVEGSLARASELGFAGCISATVNVTAPFAQTAYSGASPEARAAGLASAVHLRGELSKFPLVAAVKQAVAFMKGDQHWSRLVPPLRALDSGQGMALWKAIEGRVPD
jgi:4-hydroxy-tetrahydrodipicolinate synthase